MDLTFPTPRGIFNCRAAAVIVKNGRLLVMKDEIAPYFYLPGGRVRLNEPAEQTVLRELREELGEEGRIVRPLWFCQNFFREDRTGQNFHEFCVYYLVEIPTERSSEEGTFERVEGNRKNLFSWMPFDELKQAYFYPQFLKEQIECLPQTPQFLTVIEK